MDDIHRKILKKFHTLCGVCGMTRDEKMALVSSYGVESSADIDTHDLIDLCAKLSEQAGQPSLIDCARGRWPPSAATSVLQVRTKARPLSKG